MAFDVSSPFHVGYVVADVDQAMARLTAATGVTWHPPQVFALDIMVGDERMQFENRFTYSVEGPVQLEVVQGPSGTLWDAEVYGGPNHNGYWTDDLVADVRALVAGGAELLFAGVGDGDGDGDPQGFAMVDAGGARIELVDEAMKPLFDTWYATGTFG